MKLIGNKMHQKTNKKSLSQEVWIFSRFLGLRFSEYLTIVRVNTSIKSSVHSAHLRL